MLVAVVLICASTLSPEACTRATAVTSTELPVSSELTCLRDGQAFGAEAFGELRRGTFMKVACERSRRL